MHLRDAGGSVIGLSAGPVALQLEQILQGRHRTGTGLDRALHRAVMRLFRDIAAHVGDHIDLAPLIARGERRADDADAGQQAAEDDAADTDPVDLCDNVGVLPRVHGAAV